MTGASIFLHIDGKPLGDQRRSVTLLSVSGGIATVKDELAQSGKALYRVSDGRRVDESGEPTPWDFWRFDGAEEARP